MVAEPPDINSDELARVLASLEQSADAVEGTEIAFEFTGKARDYFRIWIVSLCLTILSLGIFSAWAKVRKLRYIYGNLWIDGTPLEYRGRPIPILKGRVVAVLLAALWYIASRTSPTILLTVYGLAAVLAPLFMARSAAFRARSTAYRNITLEFHGTTWGLAKKFYAGLLVTLFTLGFGYSWFERQTRAYLITHTGYGGNRGIFTASAEEFFGVYFRGGLAMIGLSLPIVLLTATLGSLAPAMINIVALLGYGIWIFALAYRKATIANLVWRHTYLGGLRFESHLTVEGLLKLYVVNALAILCSFGLLVPWAAMRTIRYRVERMNLELCGKLGQFKAIAGKDVGATGAEVADMFDLDLAL